VIHKQDKREHEFMIIVYDQSLKQKLKLTFRWATLRLPGMKCVSLRWFVCTVQRFTKWSEIV